MKAVTQLIRYIYMRIKHHGLVVFPYSATIGKIATFEGNNKIGRNTCFSGRMGRYSYIANECDLYAEIGRFTSIGNHVETIRYRHPTTYPYVSTSPAFYSTLGQCAGKKFATEQSFDECIMIDKKSQIAVRIGNDCWINSNVTIISGTTIHDGAIVLTGSVVTRDVPPYAIVGGIPARVIKYRYEEEDIKWLLRSKWWDKQAEWLKENWRYFNDIKALQRIFQ